MSGQSQGIGAFVDAIQASWGLRDGRRLRDSLAAAVHDAIEAGRLPPDGKLPPERVLAAQLGVSRTTVVAAYGALVESGILSRRTGSGTFLSRAGPARGGGAVSRLSDYLLRDSSDLSDQRIDFRTAAAEADEAVIPALREALSQLPPLSDRHGYVARGWQPLRVALAEHLSARGLPSVPDQVLVTNGALQAINLAIGALTDPGDVVLTESPTYPGTLDVFRRERVSVVSVPIGLSGVRSDRVREAAVRARPRLMYLTPTFSNPTGAVVPTAERERLAELAGELDIAIVEDLSQADLSFSGAAPPPPIGAFARAGRVLSIGSFSKLYWGGLRLGWVRASVPLVSRMARIKAVTDLGTALPMQVAGRELLAVFDEVRRRRQEQLRSRHACLDQLVRTWLPGWRWTSPAGGLSIWARLPSGDAEVLTRLARSRGVEVGAGTHFAMDASTVGYVRLPFARPPQILEAGIRRLAAAWQELEAGEADTSAATPLV